MYVAKEREEGGWRRGVTWYYVLLVRGSLSREVASEPSLDPVELIGREKKRSRMDKGTDVPRWLLHEQTVRGQLEYTSSRVPSLGEAMFHQKKSQRVPSGRATFATLRNAE